MREYTVHSCRHGNTDCVLFAGSLFLSVSNQGLKLHKINFLFLLIKASSETKQQLIMCMLEVRNYLGPCIEDIYPYLYAIILNVCYQVSQLESMLAKEQSERAQLMQRIEQMQLEVLYHACLQLCAFK
jgi:hypothetical protein